jgi:hypothetical protein
MTTCMPLSLLNKLILQREIHGDHCISIMHTRQQTGSYDDKPKIMTSPYSSPLTRSPLTFPRPCPLVCPCPFTFGFALTCLFAFSSSSIAATFSFLAAVAAACLSARSGWTSSLPLEETRSPVTPSLVSASLSGMSLYRVKSILAGSSGTSSRLDRTHSSPSLLVSSAPRPITTLQATLQAIQNQIQFMIKSTINSAGNPLITQALAYWPFSGCQPQGRM